AHAWGDGTAVPDLTMARSGPGQLSLAGALAMVRAAATNAVFTSSVTGDANPRWQVTADGAHAWGDGTAVPDLTMARSGPGQLSVGGSLALLGGSASAPGVKFVGGTAGLFSPGADQLAIGTASTERMRIDQTGNVGVGIQSPTAVLHVMGNTNNEEIVVVDAPAGQTTDLQTWRVNGVVRADITSTGSIELNTITFVNGTGGAVGGGNGN